MASRQALAPLSSNAAVGNCSSQPPLPASKPKRSYVHIDAEWRQRLIQRRYNDGASITSIATENRLNKSTVWHIMRRFEEDGKEDKSKTGGNVKNVVFGEAERASLLSFVDQHAEATLGDAQEHLQRAFPAANPPAISSIDRALAGAHYHLKRLETESEERNSPQKMDQRQCWVREKIGEDLHNAIYIDEAGFNLHISRRRGRAAPGQRAVQTMPKQAGKNMTLIVACSPTEGILAKSCHIGGTNKERFAQYLEEHILPLIEGQQRILFMDNVRFHHSKLPKEVVEKAGHRIIYTPPYTPQFNIAEWVFSSLKTRVSRKEAKDHGQLERYIEDRLQEITAEHCDGFFREACRWQQAALQGQPMAYTHEAPVQRTRWVANSFESSQGSSRTAGSQQSNTASSQLSSPPSRSPEEEWEDLEQEREGLGTSQPPESQL